MGEGERLVRAGKWTGWSPTSMLGARLQGKRMGIVGMGRIGQALARRARGFGLAIHYHNRKRVHAEIERELEATYWESLDQMLARMDIVSVNCPHTPATFHLLSARRLKLMKPTAIIVNTARGEVIDENALVRMLKAGELAGAGLDVYEHEPQVNPKLLELDSVVLLPHMGSATLEGRIEMGEKVLINIKTFADGHKPPDRVLATMFCDSRAGHRQPPSRRDPPPQKRRALRDQAVDHSRLRLSISTSRVERPTWAPIRMVSDVQYIQTMMAAKPAVAPNAEVSCVTSK